MTHSRLSQKNLCAPFSTKLLVTEVMQVSVLKRFFFVCFQCTIYFRLLAFRIFSKQHIYEDVIRSTDCLKSQPKLSFSGLTLKFQS